MNDKQNVNGRVTDKAKAVKWIFFTMLVVINAGLTSSFFVSNYSNAISIVTNPTLNKFLTVVVGIVLLDIGALAWLHLYENLSYTSRARNVAQFMSWAGLLASTVASVAQLTLTNTLVALGDDVINAASLVALLGISGILIAHVVAMMLWLQASPEARQLDADMEAAAESVEEQLAAKKELAAAVKAIASRQIREAMPILARLQAHQQVNAFIVGMGNLPRLASGEVDTALLRALFPEMGEQPEQAEQLPQAPTTPPQAHALPAPSLATPIAAIPIGELMTNSQNGNGYQNGHAGGLNFTQAP